MRILLAEDEKSMSKALQAILTKNNYSVDAVYDGEEAVSYVRSGDYDVVIMDIMMPKMNGIDALKEIRKKGCTVPVIMLTAKSEIDDKVEGLDVAADNTLRFGNLTLDRGSFELYTPSGKYRLAGKEFQMIELLMTTPGMLISTERFMDKIWGIDSEADISVVWTYISFLRKKLAAMDADVQIKATRNAGYSLEAKE